MDGRADISNETHGVPTCRLLSGRGFVSDATRILHKIESGDPSAAEQLLPLVYDELRKLAAARMAHEQPGHTLQATALVHEAYLRLVDVSKAQHWDSRRHFFSAAAESMRRILIESARRKRRLKRGGDRERVDLEASASFDEASLDELLDVDKALQEFETCEPLKAEVVKLRYFAGLSTADTAEVLGIAVVTVKRHWRFARAWLHMRLSGRNSSDPSGEKNPERARSLRRPEGA
jgi:RNA polymerase sigma factor (TIGR02999 family)